MSKLAIIFVVAALGCAGCQQDIIPISPDATTADSETGSVLLKSLDLSETQHRIYLPGDFKLETPEHGAQLWPAQNPNLVLWQSVLPGQASIELPPLPVRRFYLVLVARTRRMNPAAVPCIFVSENKFENRPVIIFQPDTTFRQMVSPIVFTRARTLYLTYAAGSYDDRDTNIDIRAAAVYAAGR